MNDSKTPSTKDIQKEVLLPFEYIPSESFSFEDEAIFKNNKDVLDVVLKDFRIRLNKRMYILSEKEDEKVRGEIRMLKTLISTYTSAYFTDRLEVAEENNSDI